MNPDIALTQFRSQFRNPAKLIHLNNAGQTPLCLPAVNALNLWARRLSEEACFALTDFLSELARSRQDLAVFLGCKNEELAFFPGPSGAISQVAFGLDYKAGDEILVWDQEYPSLFYAWSEVAKRRGLKLIVAPSNPDLSVRVETLARLVTPRTRVIACSWVQYRTGALVDLEELVALAKPRGIFTCVDVIQGVGCRPFDFAQSGIDAVCGGSHKWLLSPHGTGYLCLRKEHLEKLQPSSVGCLTFGLPDDLSDPSAVMKSTSLRFEPGSMSYLNIFALAEAVRLIGRTGVEILAHESWRLAKRLAEGLSDTGYKVHSRHEGLDAGSFVSFAPGPQAPLRTEAEIKDRLSAERISFALRPPGIRLSPHAFNTDAEIETTLAALSRP